jgi:hypothetical protein
MVVEVDARYIKGMLANPDIAPSASVNRWIMAILTFHFDLVHVPSSHHGPDGLSQRLCQPDDEDPQDTAEFDNWINNLHGFMHQINDPTIPLPSSHLRLSTFALATAQVENNEEEDGSQDGPIDDEDRNEDCDIQLELVKKWHDDLRRPLDYDDDQYARFMQYCAHFFISDD